MPTAKRKTATKKKATTTKRKTTTAKKKATTAKRKTKALTKAKPKKKTTAVKRKTKALTKAKPKKKTATAKAKAKKPEAIKLKTTAIRTKQTKTEIIADIAEQMNTDRKTVREFFSVLQNQASRHVKKGGSGEMTLPDLGIKVRRVKKAATKRRKGRNPFTGEEIMIKAKPASTSVRATALKALKDLAQK